jgi:cell division protein FtsN
MTQPAAELAPAVLDHLLSTIMKSTPPEPGETLPDRTARRELMRLMLLAAKPADALQALLVARAIIAEYTAIDAFRRAAAQDVPDAMAIRLRANAIALSRESRTTLRQVEQMQAPPESAPTRATRKAPTPPPAPAAEPAPEPTPVRKARFPRAAWQSPPKLWDQMTMEERRVAFGYRYDPVTDSVPPLEPETNKPA